MSRKTILRRLTTQIAKHFGKDKIEDPSTNINDLYQFDSLDWLEFSMVVEETFDISPIDEWRLKEFKTLNDIVDYLIELE